MRNTHLIPVNEVLLTATKWASAVDGKRRKLGHYICPYLKKLTRTGNFCKKLSAILDCGQRRTANRFAANTAHPTEAVTAVSEII